MELTVKERIEQFLNTLHDPNLTQGQIDKVKDKIRFLQSLDED